MKKVILFLALGVFCFSSSGFKEVRWRTSKENVIREIGEKYKFNKQYNRLEYKRLSFAGRELKDVRFNFENDRLVSWYGKFYLMPSETNYVLDTYFSKYGENSPLSNSEIKDMANFLGRTVFSHKGDENNIFIKIKPYIMNHYEILVYYREPYSLEELDRKQRAKDEIERKIRQKQEDLEKDI